MEAGFSSGDVSSFYNMASESIFGLTNRHIILEEVREIVIVQVRGSIEKY
jgi:hypothetical protein